MCGSGTTIDVCKEERRRVIGYDIAPYRTDIIQNDARSLPLPNNSVDFVFIDSPYSDNIIYSDHPACIGKISCEEEEFFDELEKVGKEIYRILRFGKMNAWLVGDHWRSRSGFIPVGFLLFERLLKYFLPVDLVCVARRHQASNTLVWHKRAREYNFYLRGFKYLLIMEKPIEDQRPEILAMPPEDIG
jgi:DNA modification methylase